MTSQKEIEDFHEALQKINDIVLLIGTDNIKVIKSIIEFQKFFIEKFNPKDKQ